MAKVSCRKAFTSALQAQARTDKNIWLLATDSRGSVTSTSFFEELPLQSADFGFAEHNAVAAEAVIARVCKYVFVSCPACFLTARSYEQVKIDVAYNQTNVKIVGVSGGVSYGPLGGTHTSLHDIAGMRALPNIQIFIPSDAAETAAITRHLVQYEGPAYMRTGRGDVENVYSEEETFEMGKAKLVREGTDVTIIACGEMVYYAKQAGEILAQQGIQARVLDMYCLRPVDKDAIVRAAKETKAILTVEEHSIYGGLGELVAHATAEATPVPVKILGFPDEEYKVGQSDELFRCYGLTAENIAAEAKALIRL
ncbi:MAG: transketolase family protein [Oscillospiraceae bacterium]